MPMGLEFFMAARSVRLLMRWLPSKPILPTLTVGPSLMMNVIATRAGGIVLTSVRTVANW